MNYRCLKLQTRLIVTAVLCFLVGSVGYVQWSKQLIPTHMVIAVLLNCDVILNDRDHIKLAGIKIPEEITLDARKYLEGILFTHPVIVEHMNSRSCELYVWGYLDQHGTGSELSLEKRGFINVHTGFLKVEKGLGTNVSALLLREGYAYVDNSVDDKRFDGLFSIQELAQKEKRGVWSKK